MTLGLFGADVVERARAVFDEIKDLDTDSQIGVINELRRMLHEISPFRSEPVDYVQWVRAESVTANDYNPNAVAPPEMRLLAHSVNEDGFTQPIVAWKRDSSVYEVVDGFHRHRVGKEIPSVAQRILGYLPLCVINDSRLDRGDRIAATIRHNRARGKHQVAKMSDIVVELKRRNWSNERICRELGMDPDEVLRLCQVTGLAELFADQDFSKSWDVEGEVAEADFEELTDDVTTYGDEASSFRTVNTSDPKRIFHTYEKWECFQAGFYATHVEGKTKAECEEMYRSFLADTPRFADALEHVVTEWKHSCEHYLTNIAMNRIAWLGQAAACYAMGLPSVYRSGFWLLTEEQQELANETALVYLNKWLAANGHEPASMAAAMSYERQSDIY